MQHAVRIAAAFSPLQKAGQLYLWPPTEHQELKDTPAYNYVHTALQSQRRMRLSVLRKHQSSSERLTLRHGKPLVHLLALMPLALTKSSTVG